MSANEQAVHIATELQGLTITVGRDGVWFNFSCDGKYTSINMSEKARHSPAGIDAGLWRWCIELAKKHGVDA